MPEILFWAILIAVPLAIIIAILIDEKRGHRYRPSDRWPPEGGY